jgi:26S proteasome regulatory subunit T2
MVDDNHCIVSGAGGPDHYVNIASFVDPDQLEPGVSVMLHNKTMTVVGILGDQADPMVSVMKVEKAPLESYADIGGLEKQIQEMKEAVELPLTHPEMYEDIGIKPPKVRATLHCAPLHAPHTAHTPHSTALTSSCQRACATPPPPSPRA